jgi:hypothetical protein
MQHQPTQPIRLDRPQRNVIWGLAASDLATLGDALHHGGMHRDLTDVHGRVGTLRSVLALLESIGWEEHDARDEYPVGIPAAALAILLQRWRRQLDGAMSDQVRAGDELSAEDRAELDADLDARLVVDHVLEAVER